MSGSGTNGRALSADLVPAAATHGADRARQLQFCFEAMTGTAALVGGSLMVVRPDGSLIGLTLRLLDATPFTDWRLPGLLLAGLVGCGFLVTGLLERAYRSAASLSLLAGAGLVLFELVEWRWIGFHPLQAVFLTVGTYLAASTGTALRRGVGAPGADGTT